MISNKPERFDSGLDGAAPIEWFGKAALDGDRGEWATAPVGSEYVEKPNTAAQKRYRRVKAEHATLGSRDDDWAQMLHCLSVTVLYSQFTDGGAAAGTYVLAEQIPVGAKVIASTLVNVTGFTGNTSAVITVGDGSDVDRYNTGTPSVFATATAIDLGAISGTAIHATAATVTITVTGGSDFTAIAAGQLTLRIYYLN